MILIDKVLVSLDIITDKFCCDIVKCKGSCCYYGDEGAPIKEDEQKKIFAIKDVLKKEMSDNKQKKYLEKDLFYIKKNETYIQTRKNKECIFVIKNNNNYKCSIQKSFTDKKQNEFEKPISCMLYPIRVTKTEYYTVLNYEKWEICKPAITKGKNEGIFLYKFLEKPLTKVFGKKWYSELKDIALDYNKQNHTI